MSRSRRIERATFPKACWSPIWSSNRSRSWPALASTSSRNMSTMALAPSGGASPVSRSRTIMPSTSAMEADARSTRARPRRSTEASRTAVRFWRTPPRLLEPIASMRACSMASKTACACGLLGRPRACLAVSWWASRSAIWSARPRMRAASFGGRSRGGWGSTARLPVSCGPSPENTTSRSGVSASDRAACASARLKGSVGFSGFPAMSIT